MNWRRTRRILLAALALAGLVFVGTVWWVAGNLVAPANHPVGPPPSGLRIESVTFGSGSGSTLAAWYVPCDGATATVILLHTTLTETRRLYDGALEPKCLVIFEGAAHNDLLAYDRETYREIVAFLDLHLRSTVTD